MTAAYPLHWPENWPRTQSRSSSRFDTSLSKAMSNVENALKKFETDSGRKVESIVVSSNFSLGDRNPKDPGVAIYFSWDGLQTCIAVDRYQKIEDNLQAIFHCIEAERTKLRHGGINLVRAAFRGYAALPPPFSGASQKKHWSQVMNLNAGATDEEKRARYRELAKKLHPDNGGSHEKMAELNTAYNEAMGINTKT